MKGLTSGLVIKRTGQCEACFKDLFIVYSSRTRRKISLRACRRFEDISSFDEWTSPVRTAQYSPDRSLIRESFYEGHELQTTAFPIRVMRLLGIKILIGQLALIFVKPY
jgi:hypothetical protein